MKKLFLLLLFVVSLLQAKINIYSTNEVNTHIGEIAEVRVVLSEVFQSNKGNVFLDIDGRYPNQKFTGVIFNEDRLQFDVSKLKNKIGGKIIIKGYIRSCKAKPEIIIKNTSQIFGY